jgi:hypothetical protein
MSRAPARLCFVHATLGHMSSGHTPHRGREKGVRVEFILWIIAVVLVISGIVTMVRGSVGYGLALIVIGLLVGPGGVSIFT